MRKLFGTDGIRAVAGQSPLDPRTIYAVGVALAHHVAQAGAQPRMEGEIAFICRSVQYLHCKRLSLWHYWMDFLLDRL